MKYLKYFLIGGMTMIITSHTSRTSKISEGINPGNLIPATLLYDSEGNELNLSELAGEKFLLNFWAAYDANSHLETSLLSNAVKKGNYPIKVISVSFDKSRSVFEKTLTLDAVDRTYQFHDTQGENSEVFKKFRLQKGFKSLLVDENGVIQGVNLSPNELKKMLALS